MSIKKNVVFVAQLFCLSFLFLSEGWANTEKELIKQADAYIESKPVKLHRFYHTLYMEGEWNAVLNFNLLGLAAMELKEFDIARAAFEQSTFRILQVYSDDPNTKKARSLWSKESIKSFKGEPYERAMAFYYSGLLYLEQGDYQNARASFLQADFQNSLAFSESYNDNFSLAKYLAAWSSYCDGDTGRADALINEINVGVEPFFNADIRRLPNSLTIVEYGLAPDKITFGKNRSLLGFLPHIDVTRGLTLRYSNGGSSSINGVAANVDYLAMTRGGRPIDGILKGKARFKETTKNVTSASQAVSSVVFDTLSGLGPSQAKNIEAIASLGIASSMIGAISSGLSNKAKSSADTRMWASLPKGIHLEGHYESNKSLALLITQNGAHSRVPSIFRTHGGCTINWVREYSGLDRADGGTGNPSPWPAEPKEKKRKKMNKKFRNFLKKSFI